MKNVFFAIAVVVACLFGLSVNAQDDAYKQELKTFIVASGATVSYDALITQMLSMTANITDEAKSQIAEQAMSELIDLMAPVYQKHISIAFKSSIEICF